MICAECKAEGRTSKVYPGSSRVTCAMYSSYYDEEGKRHHHDKNERTTGYLCSNGHNWTVKSTPEWPCGCDKDKK